MTKLFLKSMLLLCALIVGSGSAWGQVTIWSEDFSGYSADGVPSGTISFPHTGTSKDASGTLTYACTNGTKTSGSTAGGTTAVKNEALAEGSKPEIMVGKKGSGTGAVGGSFTATVPLDNIAGTITLKYKQNANGLKVTMTAGSATTNATNSSKAEQTVTLSGITAEMTSVTIKFEATSTSNVRLDNIILTGNKATVAITSIAFSEPKTASVGVGGTTTLTPTVLPANHTEVVDWESDATGVATVSSSGVVTGVSAGTAHITAKAHDNPSTIYDVCTVTVTAAVPVTGVSLKSSTTLLLGGTETLVPTILPNDATNKNVTWSSVDDTKVSVDEDGVITGVALTNGTPVNITVTTEDGSFSAICAVTVNPVPVSSVGLDKASASLVIGKTLTLEATVYPDNATNKNVTWESDDEDVATVDDGVVTAVAEGIAKITVKSVADPTKKAECTITVREGSINLSTTGEITFGSWSTSILGSSYGDRECVLTGSDDNTYYWSETDGYYNNSGWQIKKTSGKVTSPTIKSDYGFTISVTNSINDVIISDGTTTGKNSLKTTKTNTAITIVGDGTYAVFTDITITPSKLPVATELAITDPGTLSKDATGTFAYTATTEEDNTASWTSATTGVITITNAATGAYSAVGRGTSKITLTLTPTDATTYDAVTAERTVIVTAPVVITASNIAMTYGDAAKSIGATKSDGYSGTLSYESDNDAVATVNDAGKVTAVAVGTANITISAPADAEHLYTAGEKIITVTVSAPTASGTAADFTQTAEVYETLLSNTKKSGWTYTEWTSSSSYGACSTAGTAGQLITEDYLIPDLVNPCLYFEHTGNLSFSSPSSACKLYVQEGSNTPVELTIPTYFTGSDWTFVGSGDIDISNYIGKTVHFIFDYSPSTGNNGKWEVKNFGIYYDAFGVKFNADGYATYCSEHPLDFSDYATADYSAWQVTNVSNAGVITFSQITGKIKGGQGILLKGTANAKVTLTSDDSSTELGDNMLVGCMVPTYFDSGVANKDKYVLVYDNTVGQKCSKFMRLGNYNVTIPANRAYLVWNAPDPATAPSALRFEFEEENATNIQNFEANENAVKFIENGVLYIKRNGITYDVAGRKIR